MLHIQQAVAKIKEEGETRGVIVDGAFVGETSHSSWSKKLLAISSTDNPELTQYSRPSISGILSNVAVYSLVIADPLVLIACVAVL